MKCSRKPGKVALNEVHIFTGKHSEEFGNVQLERQADLPIQKQVLPQKSLLMSSYIITLK